MSRLIVKNLPKSITAEKLQQIFSEKGIITDVQLKYTRGGEFRGFGFVGYKSEEDAQKARDYFNNTFINMCRITVETCTSLGSSDKPKAWSKYAADSSAYKKSVAETSPKKDVSLKKEKSSVKNDVVQDKLKKYENEPLFHEFMDAQSKGEKGIWSNGILNTTSELKGNVSKKVGREDDTGSDDDNDSNRSDDDDDDDNGSDEDGDTLHSKKLSDIAKANISDMEYLKSKIKKNDDNEDIGDKGKTNEAVKIPYKTTYYNVKVRGIKFNSKKKDLEKFFLPLKPCSIRLPPKMKGIAYVGFKTEVERKRALQKHLGFLDGRRLWIVRSEKKTTSDSSVNSKWKEQEDSVKCEESVALSGRIFVRNLPYSVTEEEVEEYFKKYGPLSEVNVPVDRISRKVKGFATVTFLMPEHAVKAYTELDGSVFQGRMLHLIPAKEKKSLEELLEMEGLSYKEKKALKMKLEASSAHNWNSLFLGQNAVVDLIAKNYNTTKDKVLDAHDNESLAVRLALGETEIVSQTKKFLEENDVHLDAFNQTSGERSKTVILVKNLPAETQVTEIREKFSKFGELGRVLLPPSGVTAIVEFLEPSEARTAFKKLAYSKFKYLPLYLEWAPHNAFKTSFKKKEKSGNRPESAEAVEDKNINSKEAQIDQEAMECDENKKEDDDDDEEEEIIEEDTTLFIKNLNFSTREDAIREHFKKCGPIHYVSIAMKKDPQNIGQFLSLGYGFIQFKKKASAEKALKSYQQSVVDGYSIELKRSNRTIKSDPINARKITNIRKQESSKILVRNVPFQATRKEIRDLFKTFGELKAVRLPLKMVGTGNHRGFAFVEYYTKHDAKRAFKALCQSTHLYGRRLVLEWAASEENIEELRKKTAKQFAEGPYHHEARKGVANLDIEED